ncbi:MAG: ethanolamine utilization protein EutN [bacterium]|nr:MAG: ethanolamine utilization protein EutN [bacterium]
MVLGRVIGSIVSTVKHSAYQGMKILMVQPVDPANQDKGTVIAAVDKVQAGPGDRVLVMTEGNSARQLLQSQDTPVNMVIVGIVDNIEYDK